jgi:pimeloyl-ACP methyl ester carboxylesterase
MPGPAPRRRRWQALTLGVLLCALLVVALVLVVVPAIIPSALIYAPNSKVVGDLVDDPAPTLADLHVRTLHVAVGPPAASLSVWTIEGRRAARPTPTVLVLHGIRDRKASMLGWGRRLATAGFRAVLVDLRGHGRSSGRWLTYGVVDRRDLSQVIDALAGQGLVEGPMGVFGVSYGAAVAIELAGIDRRVVAVVAVAPFSSLRAVVPLYVERLLPGLGRLVPARRIDRAIDEAGERASFDPDDASPLRSIRRTAAHVLLLHGSEDRKIPPSHSATLHREALDHSRLIVVDGEGHDSIMADRRQILASEGIAWLRRWLGRPSGR